MAFDSGCLHASFNSILPLVLFKKYCAQYATHYHKYVSINFFFSVLKRTLEIPYPRQRHWCLLATQCHLVANAANFRHSVPGLQRDCSKATVVTNVNSVENKKIHYL